jgi:predicted TIM-barrel fold metal-dependent hydrolase
MPFPSDIRAIDLMVNIPTDEHNEGGYSGFRPLLRDNESLDAFHMPAQYMFRNIPSLGSDSREYVGAIIAEMDKWGVETALIPVSDAIRHPETMTRHPGRFITQASINPSGGMAEIRRIRELHREHGLRALTYFPAASFPQVPIDGKEMYPLYALCCDLDLPILINVGVPGPRVPMATQKVELIDEVCWFFPELKLIMRHGAEPWVDLAVKLMLKYPNLYYAPSAFAPKHYPKAIIDFANTRGSDKIMYAGYFPAGLSLERIFTELRAVPFKDEVWPKFLRGNAARVLGLPA